MSTASPFTWLERARNRRPISWLTIIGVVLLPVVIGGILISALYNPTERLDALDVAVVNNDEPVTIDGQMVPLGRQLTAGLVEGSDDLDSNLSWTLSNTDDAEDGLADGTYAAVITIPENFSAAATSTAPGGTPEKATIDVTTPPDSLVVDDAITAQVAQTAASLLGTQLSETYLENVLLGFTTLGDQLGEAAGGAHQLADGADQAATGAVSLADGVRQLSDGTAQLASGASGIASGADGIASGSAQLAGGTGAAANGLEDWAAGAGDIAGGTTQLANGLYQFADGLSAQLPDVPQDVLTAVDDFAANSDEIQTGLDDASQRLADLSSSCLAEGGSQELCDAVAQVSTDVTDTVVPQLSGVIAQSSQIQSGVHQLAGFEGTLVGYINGFGDGATQLAGGMNQLATGATDAAGGLHQLAGGMSSLADGAGQLADGTGDFASGAGALASGAGAAADGADELGSGVGELASGTTTLADGLDTAVDGIPSYTQKQASDTATVVAAPVSANGVGSSLFGASAIPLLATAALWFGGLATFVALQAVSRRALGARQPSLALSLRAFLPAAGLGALQGLLVAGVVQIAADYDAGAWWAFAGVAMLAGVAFAAVNQALVAVFHGAGRWISALIGVLLIATGIVSTVPGVLMSIAGIMPTAPAYQGMVAALTSASGMGAAIAGLLVWTGLGILATTVATMRRRTVSAMSLVKAAPSPV